MTVVVKLKTSLVRALRRAGIDVPVIRARRSLRRKGAADSAWYDARYRGSSTYMTAHRESPYARVWAALVDLIPSGARILEIGCGPGQLAELLYERGFRDYIGIDFSAEAIRMARRRLPQGDFVVADITETRIVQEREYDVVIATEVLEHLEDDVGVLHRLRPAFLLATVPNFDSESHMRWFRSAKQVVTRYGRHIDDIAVRSIPVGDSRSGAKLFLISGHTPAERRPMPD